MSRDGKTHRLGRAKASDPTRTASASVTPLNLTERFAMECP